MKKLSVIIVTYQVIDIVRDCLDSIKKFNDIGDELEVIVSDNSEDNTLADTIRAEYDWVKVIKNENKGFGAGNNRGYEISSGKYLLFLNPDTILVEPVFQFAVDKFENDEDLALFGVQLIGKNNERKYSFFGLDRYAILPAIWVRWCQLTEHYADGKMFIGGAVLFVRREAFVQAGLFDENIFMYKEEPDLIKRIKLYSSAKKTAFFKQKKIIHLEGGTESNAVRDSLSVLKRIYVTDKYYAQKWNIDLRQIYIDRRRTARFRLIILKLLFRKNQAEQLKVVIDYYNEKLLEL